MLALAARSGDFALSYGEGFLVPIDLDDDAIRIIDDRNRIDTSYVNIYVKVDVDEDSDVREKISDLRAFIRAAIPVGRTEILEEGDVGLSIVDPEQYRYQLVSRIADENARLVEAMGGQCEVTVYGLQRRIEWERSNVSELQLFLPYELEITNCGAE